MKNLLCIIILAYATAAWSQHNQPAIWKLEGKVISDIGNPLSGVQVDSCGPSVVRTDIHGRYSIELFSKPNNGCTVRFRSPGFKTITKVIFGELTQLDVIMQPGDNSWRLGICGASDDHARAGWHMKVLIPQNACIIRGFDVDYHYINIYFKSGNVLESMRLGTGPLWGGGSPSIHLLLSAKEIQERELVAKNQTGIDFRFLDRDGGRWRETGFFSESILYSNVSEQAAAFFDSIIDTMCWDANPVIDKPSLDPLLLEKMEPLEIPDRPPIIEILKDAK